MVKYPTLSSRRVSLFCPELLRAAACCIVDGLQVRGYDVHLETGSSAKSALKRSLRSKRSGLRVVCVEHSMDPHTQDRILEALDPGRVGDLLIVPLQTPRTVIQQIERHFGVKPKRPVARQTRAYLAHPTLVESSIDPRRVSAYASASLGAAAAIVGALFLVTRGAAPAPTTTQLETPTTQAPSSARHRVDDTVLSHAVTPVFEVPPRRAEPAPSMPAPGEPELIVIEDELAELDAFEEDLDVTTLEPAPLETIGPSIASAPSTDLDLRAALPRVLPPTPPVGEASPMAEPAAELFSPFE